MRENGGMGVKSATSVSSSPAGAQRGMCVIGTSVCGGSASIPQATSTESNGVPREGGIFPLQRDAYSILSENKSPIGIYINVIINGKQVSALIDAGASVSLLKKEWAQDIDTAVRINLQAGGGNL